MGSGSPSRSRPWTTQGCEAETGSSACPPALQHTRSSCCSQSVRSHQRENHNHSRPQSWPQTCSARPQHREREDPRAALGLLGSNPSVRSPSPNYLGLNLEHGPRPRSITSSTSTAPPGPPEEDRHHELASSSIDGHVTLKGVLGPCTPGPPCTAEPELSTYLAEHLNTGGKARG